MGCAKASVFATPPFFYLDFYSKERMNQIVLSGILHLLKRLAEGFFVEIDKDFLNIDAVIRDGKDSIRGTFARYATASANIDDFFMARNHLGGEVHMPNKGQFGVETPDDVFYFAASKNIELIKGVRVFWVGIKEKMLKSKAVAIDAFRDLEWEALDKP